MLDGVLSNSFINVAASKDLTGHASTGGDWVLEMGNIDAEAIYFSSALLSSWAAAIEPVPQVIMVEDIQVELNEHVKTAVEEIKSVFHEFDGGFDANHNPFTLFNHHEARSIQFVMTDLGTGFNDYSQSANQGMKMTIASLSSFSRGVSSNTMTTSGLHDFFSSSLDSRTSVFETQHDFGAESLGNQKEIDQLMEETGEEEELLETASKEDKEIEQYGEQAQATKQNGNIA